MDESFARHGMKVNAETYRSTIVLSMPAAVAPSSHCPMRPLPRSLHVFRHKAGGGEGGYGSDGGGGKDGGGGGGGGADGGMVMPLAC